MAYCKVLRLWRVKFPFAISVSLNIFLLILMLTWYFYGGSRHDPEGDASLQIIRRSVTRDSTQTKCYVFVLILTAPGSQERRNAIRKTWLELAFPSEYSFIHKFAVGTHGLDSEYKRTLITEQEKHSDMLFLNGLKDSYSNLTLKVLESFSWIAESIDAKFVLKVDDDSFVRLGDLVLDLQAKETFGRIYWGFFRGDANVKKIGPWKEPNWILCDKYLPYANGGGYVLSYDLVRHISMQKNMLQLYNSEDVSVGKFISIYFIYI